MNPKMPKKYMSPYYNLYWLLIHVESPKYKMIAYKITKIKSSEFAVKTNRDKKSLTMFILSCCNNYLIEFLKIRKLKK